MTLFQAKISDVKRIEECARRCCVEHGEDRIGGPFNWEHYRKFWSDLILNSLGVMFLYEDGGRVVGGLGGGKHLEPLTGLWRASQIFLYALPEYRGRISIRRLFRQFELWAVIQGCRNVMQPLLDTMPDTTGRFYEIMGYRAQQTNYLKRLL